MTLLLKKPRIGIRQHISENFQFGYQLENYCKTCWHLNKNSVALREASKKIEIWLTFCLGFIPMVITDQRSEGVQTLMKNAPICCGQSFCLRLRIE